ncbi:MAG: hypothetical protein N2745_01315 [Syntrophorhabdaceae bacterium]|nr:hypothetical protein [Syntrophorhabdaceae bacterium]
MFFLRCLNSILKGFKNGFTLIEAMIGITILTFSLMGVVAMMVYFGSQTTDKKLKSCLLDSAASALQQFKGNALPISSSFTCENITGTISVNPTTYPSSNTCTDVTATASALGKSLTLTTKVCNFN